MSTHTVMTHALTQGVSLAKASDPLDMILDTDSGHGYALEDALTSHTIEGLDANDPDALSLAFAWLARFPS